MKFYSRISLLAIVLFIGCKPKDNTPPDKGNDGVTVTFRFNPMFGADALSWANYYITAAGDTIKFDNIKFLLSDFTFEKTSGEFVVLKDAYAYISLKAGRDSVILKGVPMGDYKSVRFQVGVDSVINFGDPAQWPLDHPLSPTLNAMHWSWASGYIFNIVEGYYKNKGAEDAFSYHVATLKNARIHSFVTDYSIKQDGLFIFNVNMDKYFSNVVNFSIKTDGSYSHSGSTDPVMDKFMQNANGILEFKSFK